MRWSSTVGLALFAVACNGFFEDNPDFSETDGSSGTTGDGATTAPVASDEVTTAADAVCAPDGFELNDVEGEVAQLPPIPMSAPSASVSATLEGTGAVDWYAFSGMNDGTDGRAKATVSGVEDLRVCVFLKCADNSMPVVDCGLDEPDTAAGTGFPGCCALDTTSPTHTCNGQGGADALVHVRVSDALDRGQCLDYELAYFF